MPAPSERRSRHRRLLECYAARYAFHAVSMRLA
ncbi:hypothetical protein GA0074696_0498 [Micromonospora purpureochromogenes]|uniref:Uncharacterized protein n=1 Tax=Micromonospora purpureochromogenes TaxID=47872 RepID=A0A1C4UMU1_9ACTN|nr:hypothetical protein GA0074696_0498 [Micromonospora purpureochromogenes]